MKRIYQAADLQEAHLLAGLLGAEGVEVKVFNENAQGGLGEIPFVHVYPELWVMDDGLAARAEALIARYESDRARPAGPAVLCPHCGEENPANFEFCWHCGQTIG